jgi:ribosomal protein S18 acetylase RimI-like enzyme
MVAGPSIESGLNPAAVLAADVGDLRVLRADYADPAHARALTLLLDLYARDETGGGKPLSPFVLDNVVRELAKRPQAFSVLAFVGEQAAGLVNCIEGFSTFACKPLVNVHDVVVHPGFRKRGVAHHMLEAVEGIARERGCCKLTLEVLQGNAPAIRLYKEVGFVGYQLTDGLGQAVFLQKPLA